MTTNAHPAGMREEFERGFNARTLAYLPGFEDRGGPVAVCIGPDANCPAGHALAVCLFGMLARAHRALMLIGDPDHDLLCPSPFGHRTLGEATAGLAQAINPFVHVDVAESLPATAAGITLGVGRAANADLQLGANGFIASVGPDAQLVDREASCWGALLSACIGASLAFHRAAGRAGSQPHGCFSLWDLGAPTRADGPYSPGPIEVGAVLQAGAGAVGCGLDFALSIIGVRGAWTIVDGDFVDLTNLNRQMLFLAGDAGWPAGPAVAKAGICATRLRTATGSFVTASPRWYGDDPSLLAQPFDVVLALANERGVRSALQARQPTVLLHATTSDRWTAQVHRHVAGSDDCIDCRIPPSRAAMKCSNVKLEAATHAVDASLPFLSMTAGVLLAAQLARLQHGASLHNPANQVIFDMATPIPLHDSVRRSCASDCRVRLPRDDRIRIDASSRWVVLDECSSAPG